MARYIYAPDHPEASENGFIPSEVYHAWKNEHFTDSGIHVISDIMDDTRHMADGKFYNSKAKFRAVTKAHGCIEVGNDASLAPRPRPQVQLDRRERRNDIAKAIWELKNGRRADK